MRATGILLVLLLGTLALASTGCSGYSPEPDAEQQLAFGVQMAQRGLWSEALFRFRQAERARPGDAEILNNIAVAHEAIGRFDEALTYYQQALRADPNSPELRRNYVRFAEFYEAYAQRDEAQEGEADAEESGSGDG